MAYLFDTDAVSEVLRPRPLAGYLDWLRHVPRDEQFISAVSVGELFRGAYRSAACQRHLSNITERVLPRATVLPYDAAVARVYGQVCAALERNGMPLADADIQIAATALRHGLALVTGNVGHFDRIPALTLCRVLDEARDHG